MYPKAFANIIEEFEKLPGVGIKTAQRYAFALLEKPSEEIREIAQALLDLKKIKRCNICGFISEEETCPICKDKKRDFSKIMVVAYPQDVLAIENTQFYQGTYHVLNGLISPSKGIYPEDINLQALKKRLNNNITKEIIIATSPTSDGELTALYLDNELKNSNILVTRIAHGLPMGASLDYADELTLIKALTNRREIEKEE